MIIPTGPTARATPPVWVTYVRRANGGPWRLEAFSVLGPERARALAEREHARDCVRDAEFRVVRFASIRDAPNPLEP